MYFFEAFIFCIVFAGIWMIICLPFPPLRRSPGLSYGGAMVFAFIPVWIGPGGVTGNSFIGWLLAAGVLFWRYNAAKARQQAESGKDSG
jgi:hypothetical protein